MTNRPEDWWPTECILEDVRCFQGVEQGQIRPITLLVGENSTGKSTFLGCYATAHSMLAPPFLYRLDPDFTDEPYPMGSFRDIVRARRGPAGRIDEFKLGIGYSDSDRSASDRSARRITATFREEGSQPTITSLRYQYYDAYVDVQRSEDHQSLLKTPVGEASVDFPFVHIPMYMVQSIRDFLSSGEDTKRVKEYLHEFAVNWGMDPDGERLARRYWLTSVAPLRAKPQRTYNPAKDTASPEGAHVPMVMMRLHRTDRTGWGKLHDDLVGFGRESGMFSDIKVKAHGRQMSDPFQLQVKVRTGSHANIMDVGYGVSQSLPILVDILSAQRQGFILQQPEVHLHPRGQAELASFFVEATRKRRNRFLIETHSDHIVDRIRISVRRGLLRPEDVSILYFEPHGSSVQIHSMSLDKQGNLRGEPVGYREFFARETDRLLGFEY